MIHKFTFLKPTTTYPQGETRIYNKNGLLYFNPEVVHGKVNIPAGVWYFKCDSVTVQPHFLPYCKTPKELESVDISSLEFNENPAKASINLITNDICVDNNFKDCGYLPLLPFLICHEVAHTVIDNNNRFRENICDIIAIRYMLSKGYNPSQINVIATVCLSSPDRVKFIHNYINKKQYLNG